MADNRRVLPSLKWPPLTSQTCPGPVTSLPWLADYMKFWIMWTISTWRKKIFILKIIRSHFASQTANLPCFLDICIIHHIMLALNTSSKMKSATIQLVLEILTCNLHWLSKCSILKNLQSTPASSAQKIFNSPSWSKCLQIKNSHCQVTVEMYTLWSPGNYWQENLETRHKALGSSRKWKQLLPEIMQLEKLERAK